MTPADLLTTQDPRESMGYDVVVVGAGRDGIVRLAPQGSLGPSHTSMQAQGIPDR